MKKKTPESNLDFSYEPEVKSERRFYRAAVHGVSASLEKPALTVQVRDICISGISFASKARMLAVGQNLRMSLYIGNKLFLRDLEASVVRFVNDEYVACEFHNLTRKQEFALDKLVLEVQKKFIALRKASAPSEECELE